MNWSSSIKHLDYFTILKVSIVDTENPSDLKEGNAVTLVRRGVEVFIYSPGVRKA